MLPARMPAVKDASIVKIAVTPPDNSGQQLNPLLIEFDQRQPLSSIINDLCAQWNLDEAEDYALKFTDTFKGYVTEKNRSDVKNGCVLKLNYSATRTVTECINVFRTGSSIELTKCLELFAGLASDPTFAAEFINKQGMDLLIKMIEDEKCIDSRLQHALRSFTELMDHGTVSWEILDEQFITRNIHFINASTTSKPVVESSLSILENIVQNSTKSLIVEQSVTVEVLFKLLRDTSLVIKQNTIALINGLFIKADEVKRASMVTTISTKQYRSVIHDCVLSADIGSEMTHQLSILQSLTLGMLARRMNDRNVDNEAREKIKELKRIAFEGEGGEGLDTSRRPNTQYYRKLGFKNDLSPQQDFMESSLLALDCMIYFARNYTQLYTKVVHENSCRADEYECPFGRTSIELVRVLCEILKIGESYDQAKDFHPMIFTHDHPFEEFFCVCIVALNKTWKDMRATSEDFSKVFDVVREQIVRNLAAPATPRDFESFRQKMNELNYFKITEMRQQERTAREECESTAPAIVSLKEKIRPEIMSLIREQRLGFLVEGTRFSKYIRGTRSKDKFWYVRLSQNHKLFHYGDCDEKTVPDELKTELRVNDMKQLLINKECPHIKEMKGRKPNTLFSIAFDCNGEQRTLDFVAPDDVTFNYWIDGEFDLLSCDVNFY